MNNYTTLKIAITNFVKSNKLFSIGRARIFYEGANQNRSIITEEVGEQLISTIPGTPIVGSYDDEDGDFEGHEENQIAYGFVPLEPNATKVEITEEIMGVPVKRMYYEVDVVIWDGRFPEARKILEEGKTLSMELNPDTIQGELEIYGDKFYMRFTYAEFRGITILGDEKTPCFKDARFLQTYSAMLSAYTAMVEGQQSENIIGGKDMTVINAITPEVDENVESVETDTTIVNEGEAITEVETEVIEEPVVEEVAEIVTEEGTEIEKVIEVTEEVTEITEVNEEDAATEVVTEEEQDSLEALTETITQMTAVNEALAEKVNLLTASLNAYEKVEKNSIVAMFSKKIVDSEFMKAISENVDKYSVDDLKAALGEKLAEQVLAEAPEEDKKIAGMNYSFTALVESTTKNGDWTDLVRANKNK